MEWARWWPGGWRWPLVGALLLGLVAVFFWPIALAGLVLADYDLIAYFYPYRAYAARAIAEGRLPLWNPEIFFGAPFLANIQAAVFYPPNWPGLLLPPAQAVNLAILLHAWLASLAMLAFGRASLRLGWPPALLGALAFAFGGFLSQQVGHPNQLSVSAWLPLLLLLLDLAVRQQSYRLAAAAGAVLALQLFAGHTQEVYISLVGAGLFWLFLLAREASSRLAWRQPGATLPATSHPVGARGFGRARVVAPFVGVFVPFAILLAVGFGLAAVQLVPTYELAGLSIRAGGMSFAEATSFSLPPPEVARALLPGYVENPFSEYVAYVGVVPLALAVVAWTDHTRRRETLFLLLLGLFALVLALGAALPGAPGLYTVVPGLRLFRVPARWLFLYSFAIAALAGVGLEALRAGRPDRPATRRLAVLAVPTFLAVLGLGGGAFVRLPTGWVVATWVGLAGLVAGTWVLAGARRQLGPALAWGLVAVAVAELFFARADLPQSRAVLPEAVSLARPGLGPLLVDREGPFRALSVASSSYYMGDTEEWKVALRGVLSERGIVDFLVAAKYQDLLTPNTSMSRGVATIDGYDGGVLPLRRYVEFKRLLLASGGILPDGHGGPGGVQERDQPDALLRVQLAGLPDPGLLGRFNVRYVLADRQTDAWLDGVYYDLATTAVVEPGAPRRLGDLPVQAATAVGLVTHLEGIAPADGQPVALVRVVDTLGRTVTTTLRAGVETALANASPGGPLRAAGERRGRPGERSFLATVRLGEPRFPAEVQIEFLLPAGRLVVRGLSVVDQRTGANEPVGLDPRLRIVQMGDLKVYRNLADRGRAWIARDYVVESRPKAAIAAIARAGPEEVVLDRAPAWPATDDRRRTTDVLRPSSFVLRPSEVRVLDHRPESVRLRVRLEEPGLVVLTDSYYPGWEATVDGVPVEILRADHLFRAVALPAGEHAVEFAYRPRSLLVGAAISLATVLAVGLLLVRGLLAAARG